MQTATCNLRGKNQGKKQEQSLSLRCFKKFFILKCSFCCAFLIDHLVFILQAGKWHRPSPQLRPCFLSLVKAPPDDLALPQILTSVPPPLPLHVHCETSSGFRTQTRSKTPKGESAVRTLLPPQRLRCLRRRNCCSSPSATSPFNLFLSSSLV